MAHRLLMSSLNKKKIEVKQNEMRQITSHSFSIFFIIANEHANRPNLLE